MKRTFSIISGILAMIFSTSLLHSASAEFEKARKLLLDNKAACVLMKNDKIVMTENGRGVAPLLVIYDKLKGDMKGTVVVDKVIGRATAAIAICGKVKHVHAEVMSKDAVEFLKQYKITSSYTLLVPRILNRKRDGLCPMEATVEKIKDPKKAVEAIRAKQIELRKNAR